MQVISSVPPAQFIFSADICMAEEPHCTIYSIESKSQNLFQSLHSSGRKIQRSDFKSSLFLGI